MKILNVLIAILCITILDISADPGDKKAGSTEYNEPHDASCPTGYKLVCIQEGFNAPGMQAGGGGGGGKFDEAGALFAALLIENAAPESRKEIEEQFTVSELETIKSVKAKYAAVFAVENIAVPTPQLSKEQKKELLNHEITELSKLSDKLDLDQKKLDKRIHKLKQITLKENKF